MQVSFRDFLLTQVEQLGQTLAAEYLRSHGGAAQVEYIASKRMSLQASTLDGGTYCPSEWVSSSQPGPPTPSLGRNRNLSIDTNCDDIHRGAMSPMEIPSPERRASRASGEQEALSSYRTPRELPKRRLARRCSYQEDNSPKTRNSQTETITSGSRSWGNNIMMESQIEIWGRRSAKSSLSSVRSFRSFRSFLGEPEHLCTEDFVIFPSFWLFRAWSSFISLLVIFNSVFTPLHFAFQDDLKDQAVFDTISDVCFALDILLTFNVALNTKNGLITNRRIIALRYALSPRLWIDLAATVPFDTLYETYSSEDPLSNRDREIFHALGMLRLLRVNRLLILFHDLQKNTYFNLLGVVVAKFVVFILLCTHTSGCIFYALARNADFNADTWVAKVDETLPERHLATRYVHVLFWAVGTFKAGPGIGSLSPSSNSEMILACLTMMVNICLQTYLVSNMAALLTTADVRIYAMRNQLRQLNDFFSRYKLPKELRTQMKSFITFKFTTDQELDQNVLAILPELYRQRISHLLYEELIAGVSVFAGCQQLFLRQLHGALMTTLFMPDQWLANIDEPANALQIVAEGEVELCYHGAVIDVCYKGESFSAVPFICKVGQPFTVRTKELTRVLSLDHAAWDHACATFPETPNLVKVNLLNYCRNKAQAFCEGTTGHSIYNELYHVVDARLVQQREMGIAAMCSIAARGDVINLKKLLMTNHSPNCANCDSRTPLHLAAAHGHTEVISVLLECKAEVDPIDNFGHTPLLEACRAHQDTVARELHRNGAVLGPSKKKKVHSRQEDPVMSTESLSLNSEVSDVPSDQKVEAGELCQAAKDVEKVWYLKALLRYGVDANVGDWDDRTALHVACTVGNKSAVESLTSQRDIKLNLQDNFGRTPLMEAVRHGHAECAQILQEHGAKHGCSLDVRHTSRSNVISAGHELCQAAFTNQVDYLNNLLTYGGVEADAPDYDSRTALMLACAEGHLDSAVLLVQNGADIHKEDRWGHTPITEAQKHGHTQLANVLSEMGAHRCQHLQETMEILYDTSL